MARIEREREAMETEPTRWPSPDANEEGRAIPGAIPDESDDDHDHDSPARDGEIPSSAQAFFEAVTARPDVDEIMRRLADS